ncbi:MAG: hypothetical protein IJ570_01150 [Prevotella sp.]|nr:hypothetical protein [Prevotella sp.]
MTTREIKQAIKDGCVVVLRHDPRSRLCIDLFGNLVVESLHREPEPTRMATLGDKRRAKILPKQKNNH